MGARRRDCGTRRRAEIAAFVVVLLASGLGLIPGAAVRRPPIAATGGTTTIEKLSPRLAALADGTRFASNLARARSLSIPATGVGSLVERRDGRFLVEIRTNHTSASSVAQLRALGARVVNVSAAYATVTAEVLPSAMRALAASPLVRYVNEVLAPHVGQVTAAPATGAATPSVCAPIVSEGDSLMNVAAARAANHLDGTGTTVGIISDSFDTDSGAATHAATDVTRGELPGPGNPCGYTTPVTVQSDDTGFGTTDEGRAMAQVTHDLAPGARLVFASAGNGDLDFASQITKLRTVNHADVIVDDVLDLEDPFFQDGPVANAANEASAAGVAYFSAAGNSNTFVDGKNVSSYEAPAYRPTSCPVALGEAVLDCHNFDTAGTSASDQITLPSHGGFDLDLQWAEPRNAVSTDFDLFVVKADGLVLAQSEIRNSGSGKPFEFVSYTNPTSSAQDVRIVIARVSGSATPRLKFVFLDSDMTAAQFNTSHGGDIIGPSIFGHNGTSTVGTTAAIPYNNANAPEGFSSRGPETLYFEPTPSTTPLGSPQVFAKPDFAATDGVKTSFLGPFVGGAFRFYGTSASAPQAAAIGALLIAKDPRLTSAQVMATLHDTARAVATNGTADAVGGGYLDANAALASVPAVPGAPDIQRVVSGDGIVTLVWSAPTTGGAPLTGYSITPYIAGVAQTPKVFSSTDNGVNVTGLNNGTTYTFTVAALNANGPGIVSGMSDAVTVGTPVAPTNVVVTPGNAQVALNWVAPIANNGSTITGYVIAPFLNGIAQTQQHVPLATGATVGGLTIGVSYTFEVAATSNRGTGDFSPPTDPITVGAPGGVTIIAVSPASNGAIIRYTAAAANGAPVTHYGIQVFDGGSHLVEGGMFSNATTQTVLGLNNGSAVRLQVTAYNGVGAGPPSALSPAVIPGRPSAPVALQATPGNGRVTLHWTAPKNNGAAITSYQVIPYVRGGALPTRIYGSATTTVIVSGLPNARTYTFKVAAVSARGAGPRATTTAVTVGAPVAPAGASAAPGQTNATVRWHAPANNGAPISAYVVTPFVAGIPAFPRTFHSTATTVTVTGLLSGKHYTFKISAINARGTGPQSNATNVVAIS